MIILSWIDSTSTLPQVWNTIHLIGPQLLKLSFFKVEELEMAVTAPSYKGVCPILVLEVIHRLLATFVADRKDPVSDR